MPAPGIGRQSKPHGNLGRAGVFAIEVTQLIDIHTLIAASPRILILLWGVALPFCAFAGWLFLFLAISDAPFAAALLAGSFLLIGVTLLVGTIELTLHYWRYAALRLTLTGEPPAVGKHLDAIIDLPTSATAAWVGVELACVHITLEPIGANRTVTLEKDCWSIRRQFAVQRRGRRGSAVVRFDIPDSLPPSGDRPAARMPASAESARERYVWELRLRPVGAHSEFRPTLGVHVLPPPSGGSDGSR